MLAAMHGRDKMVSLLVEKGANIHLQNNDGKLAYTYSKIHTTLIHYYNY